MFYPQWSRNLIIKKNTTSISFSDRTTHACKPATTLKRKHWRDGVVFLYNSLGSPTYDWVTTCVPVSASYLYQWIRYKMTKRHKLIMWYKTWIWHLWNIHQLRDNILVCVCACACACVCVCVCVCVVAAWQPSL